MARGPHLLRRGAVYYWQRRLPTHLANRLQISHVKVNLKTKDVATARRLVPPLDARAMEVFMDESTEISREQLGSLFKAVLVEHQKKLGLFADLNRAEPRFERSELLAAELAQGHAYRLLSLYGAKARALDRDEKLWKGALPALCCEERCPSNIGTIHHAIRRRCASAPFPECEALLLPIASAPSHPE